MFTLLTLITLIPAVLIISMTHRPRRDLAVIRNNSAESPAAQHRVR